MEDIYKEIENCVTRNNSILLNDILNQNHAVDLNNGELYRLNPPLYRGARLGFYSICKTLIAHGADVNYTKDHIFYPLEGAAASDSIEIAKLLISNNADINGYDIVRLSAIGAACTKGHYDMVRYLIDCGADINRVDIGLYVTPLDLTVIWNHEHLYKLLTDLGAISNINHDFDWTMENGGGISAYIDYYIGRVVPTRFNLLSSGIFYRIAVVNKNQNVLLYSIGNYQYSNPPTEFIMVLPSGWNPYSKEDLFAGLPYKIMDWMSGCMQAGRIFFDGEFVCFDEIIGHDININDYVGFYIVDYNYSTHNVSNDKNLVTLFTLVPQKNKKKSQYNLTPQLLQKIKGKKLKSLEWKNIPVL